MPEQTIGQSTATIALLPARVAYLIAAGSKDGFRRATQEASSRWAGMTELIIPVYKRGRVAPAWTQMAEVGALDCAVNIDVDPEAAQTAAAKLGLRLVPLKYIDRSEPSRWSINPVNVAALTGGEGTVVMAIGEESPLWEVAAAGDLTPENIADLGRDDFVRRPRTGDELGRAQLFGTTLLARGLHQFGEYGAANGPWPAPTIVWVSAPGSLKDCVWFWNCRALRSLTFEPFPMFIFPNNDIDHWVQFGDQLRSTLARSAVIEPDVIVCSLSTNDIRLHAIASLLGLQLSTGELQTKRVFPAAPKRTPPFTYKLNLDIRYSNKGGSNVGCSQRGRRTSRTF